MKKLTSFLLLTALLFSFCACGKVSDAKERDVPSDMYSEADITSAINTIKREFIFWDDCTLLEIYYAGDEMTRECQEWAERYGADEAIVLMSSFYVGENRRDVTLNKNSTYDYWNWILVRTEGGRWKHVDHGFM